MALQTEVAFDVLAVVYSDCDYIKLTDQSSWHGKAVKDALDTSSTNVKYVGKKLMRKTIVTDVGQYQYNDSENPQLQVGDERTFIFEGEHPGPFYIKGEYCLSKKFDRPSCQPKKIKSLMGEIISSLKKVMGL